MMRKYDPEELNTLQLYCKTSEKYSVVTHYSGPMAMITFEDVANHLASFTNTDMDSKIMSPIADIFVGNNVATGEKKILKQPAIMIRDDVDLMPDIDEETPFAYDDAMIELEPNTQDREVLDELDLSSLDVFDEPNEPSEEQTPESDPDLGKMDLF